jgi:hypothetical protein
VGFAVKPSTALRISTPVAAPGEDDRFRRLVGADWHKLPAPVRRRFSRRLPDGGRQIFVGELAYTRLSFCGWLLGQLARLLGAPLPLSSGGRAPVTVVVTESRALGGQIWTRIYGRERGFPQVIQSAKCFSGPSGCEELVGAGVGMRLSVGLERRALVFRSHSFFIRVGHRDWRLPSWLTPGSVEVIHREERAGRFSFTLRVTHPWFGCLAEQLAFFNDASEDL